MPELDVFRGLAIVAVVLYHGLFASFRQTPRQSAVRRLLIYVSSPGYLGVELFFVLSGFLITGILLDRRTPSAWRQFYARRARRLLPALALILIALAVTGSTSPLALLGSALFVANLMPLLGVTHVYSVLWSLGVEEQFYLVWPQVVWRLSRRAVTVVAVAVLIAEPIIRIASFGHVSPSGLLFYTWYNLDGLAIGALLAVFVRAKGVTRHQLRRAAQSALALGVLALLLGYPVGVDSRHLRLGAGMFVLLMSVVFSAILALVLLRMTSGAHHKQVHNSVARVLSFFGKISYGLYLVHLLAFSMYDWFAMHIGVLPRYSPTGGLTVVVTRFLVGAAVATALAATSRWTVEAWFLKRRNLAGGVRIRNDSS